MVRQKVQLTDEMYITLINEIKKKGSIWNPEDENFNDRFHVMASWKEIAKTCDLPGIYNADEVTSYRMDRILETDGHCMKRCMDVDEAKEDVVKSKWKNLRDLFKREVKKNNMKSLDEYTGRWKHFKTLWFLHRPEDSTTNNDDDEDNEESNINYEEFETATEHFVKVEPADRSDDAFLTDEMDPIPDKRRRYNDDDFDMMYLKSLTPYFRQLDPIRKLVVRSKIQDMLMNEIAAQTASTSNRFSNNN